MTNDTEVKVMANAIGFAMFHDDGRPVTTNAQGVEQTELTEDETRRCIAAAERALEHLTLHWEGRV